MTENIISNKENKLFRENNKIHIIKENIKEKDSQQTKKQYEYPNRNDYIKVNNNKNQKEFIYFNNKTETPNKYDKININYNYLEEIRDSCPKNKLKQSSPKPKNICETNYCINKISNVRYINGSNKSFSEINYIRNPDLEFISNENIDQIQNKKKFKIIRLEPGQKNTFDRISNCSYNKSGYNNLLNNNLKIIKLKNEDNNNLNYKGKIVKRKYFVNNLNNKKDVKILGRNLNVEIFIRI